MNRIESLLFQGQRSNAFSEKPTLIKRHLLSGIFRCEAFSANKKLTIKRTGIKIWHKSPSEKVRGDLVPLEISLLNTI